MRLLLLAFVLSLPATSFAAEPSAYAGSFALADAEATKVAIEGAVEQGAQQFPALFRPLARTTLRRVVKAVDTFTFEPGANSMLIRTELNPDGWTTDLAGTQVQRTNPKGDTVDIKRWMEGGNLRAKACTDAGCSEFTWALTSDSKGLSLHVITSSERLEDPLTYTLVYARK